MKTRSYWAAAALILSGLLAAPASAGVGEGQELYDAYCQVCHGGLGEGQTMGKPLTDGMAKGLSDEALIDVIANGRSGTGMAAWGGSFNETEIFDVASYVRVLQGGTGLSTADAGAGAGDDPAALAGERLFNGAAGCASCHSYRDQGGSVGPALDGIGSWLGEAQLREALSNPSATIVSAYEAKVVTQQDGTVVRGRFRNESELAVQIQSSDGSRWVTYFKDRVAAIEDADASLMPDVFADLGATEQENLLAFLNSL
jgi:putative heme-binding domain-containing protein